MWKPQWLKEPCKDGTCLVKSSCILLKGMPWDRNEKCPIYEKWSKRRDRVDNIQEFISGSFFIILCLSICGWIIGTFGLGLWEEWKYVADFLREWFS